MVTFLNSCFETDMKIKRSSERGMKDEYKKEESLKIKAWCLSHQLYIKIFSKMPKSKEQKVREKESRISVENSTRKPYWWFEGRSLMQYLYNGSKTSFFFFLIKPWREKGISFSFRKCLLKKSHSKYVIHKSFLKIPCSFKMSSLIIFLYFGLQFLNTLPTAINYSPSCICNTVSSNRMQLLPILLKIIRTFFSATYSVFDLPICLIFPFLLY